MSNAKTPLRPGMTALAAVIAISSTPLFAQSVDGSTTAPPVEAAPAISMPAPEVSPTEAAAPASATPVAQTPAMESPAPVVAVPTAVTTPAPASITAEPEAAPVTKSTRRVERKATTATEAPAASAATATPAAAAPPIVEEALPEVAPMAGAPMPEAVEPLVTQTTSESATSSDMDASDILPFAGAGVLIVGGAAYALSRRKRRQAEDDDFVLETETPDVVMTPVAAPAYSLTETSPVWTKEPVVAPKRKVVTGRRDSKLPEGFDISIYGPHVQEAYRGPTADNPSLSLKRRLKRARFFDQRDRRLGVGQANRTADPAPAFNSWQTARTLEPAY